MTFDVNRIRAEFPILSRTVHGKPLVYLDSAASAQKPGSVIAAMSRAYETSYANVHRGLHQLANEVTDAFEGARERARAFLNAAATDEIVFTKGATEAINLVAASIGLELRPGDEILLTEMEHHANIVPWHFLRERSGAVIRWAPVTEDGELDMEAFAARLGPRTRLVGVSQMSNVLGTANPVREIVRMAHAAGARVLVDGCQGVVHGPVNVQDLDADFYVFSGHKLFGPTGIGVLYGKAQHLRAMAPYQGGGEMIESVSLETVTYAPPPHRFEAGTPPIVEAIGLGAAIDWLGGVDRVAAEAHTGRLLARARERLADQNGIREIGVAPGKGPIFSFSVEGAHPHDVAQVLDRHGVAVRAGTHCAEPIMRRFGLGASVRASFALYNTIEEVDVFADALIRARRLFE